MSKPIVAALTCALILLAVVVPATAAKPPELHRPIAPSPAALLDGRPATVLAGAAHHCADIGTSSLTCFTSAATRDQYVSDHLAASPLSLSSAGYVVAYADASFLGASVVLSQDYVNLTSIGWNDRISSYKVYTSPEGEFYEDASFSGSTQMFCCYSTVSYVGNAYNDTFSSLALP
jgi:hypothetical protein